jgi:hypothetical protein
MARSQIKIDKNTSIEDLLSAIPVSVNYLRDKGIRCFVCGEPIWGTIQSACMEKGFTDKEISIFVKEINELA